ncbi:MAG: hypothetical protein AYK22_05275 [Thermoplasmatales archaeon SG8-52-3]|nr:MAG: hypothetical protein AYK22_05275 [Thermoplasmatales archaeon SG8-52-3]
MKKRIIVIFVITLLIITTIHAVADLNINLKYEQKAKSNYPGYFKETYMVSMRDGIKLATDVYLPYEGCPPHGSILIRLPYNKDNVEHFLNGQGYDLEEWVESGWPFIVQDERGYYASEGDPSFTGNFYFDGYDTIEWIITQEWSNGKVATWGRSAFGINQYWLAGTTPPNLFCQFIGVATSNIYKDFCYFGGQLNKATVEYYYPESTDDFETILSNENFSTGFWSRYILEDKWSNVEVPAVHIGGWYDSFSQGTIDAFIGYQHNGGNGALGKSKLIMGPWAHTQFGYNESDTGDLTFPDNQYDIFSRNMFLDMINQYTNSKSSDFEKWPTVSYYVMSDVDDFDAPGNEWRYADDWPILAEETSYYFHDGGVLNNDIPNSNSPISYIYDPTDPVPTLGGNNLVLFQGPKDQRPVENRDDVLIFTSDTLTKPIESTGHITARLFVSSDCPDTDFTVKLSDVYPDGRSMLVTDGILRMRNRNGNDHWEFMNSGEIYEVEVDLWSTSYIWNEDHKIRVAVSSSNYPRFLANPNTGQSILEFYQKPTYNIAQNTLYIDSSNPSCIILQHPNVAPGKPTINGPSKGKKNIEYDFIFNANDPEEDQIYYYIDWGDKTTEDDWNGPYNSGEDVIFKHQWDTDGTYIITVRAKDINGLWSNEETHEIIIPRNKFSYNLFERFFKNYLNFLPMLKLIFHMLNFGMNQ